MKTIIVGGGKVGYYLLKTLKAKGLAVILIEKNQASAELISDELNVDVILGDGTDLNILKESGIQECGMIAAVTGSDEENLVICQIAKVQFGIAKTIARINNPKNIDMFQRLGVDKAICSTKVIADLIEFETETDSIKIIQTFDLGAMVLVQIAVTAETAWASKLIKNMDIPKDCVIVSIYRAGGVIYPRGDSIILPGDELLVVIDRDQIPRLRRALRFKGASS